MTPQEAKELVEQCGFNINEIKHATCERIVISALEKQIPKKGTIKYLSSYTDDPPVLLCPNCQEHIPTEGCNFYKYCYKCGQALDWRDSE